MVIGIGTHYSDFTTASRTAFQNPNVTFVNVNVASFDAAKQSAVSVVGDARSSIEAHLSGALEGYPGSCRVHPTTHPADPRVGGRRR